ncbi:MAG TPA: efflux RND transporter periplasmic adaptor subunit [Syntrophorhabdaceae bacterium]|jgi:RND family efflux transporter MFP subunit|nr:efflux RND transporter periplasmic adaptor subunit [Syntrophorhabdaceae bacterium]OQC48350.1 MAG: Macrolide export protein MacA [Deltaproteobacteria bacterium ADurb.Bin026]HNQ64180.1 efflux RND transporter periplasmic adaptor subunit [Syntrophorhabdaceae bacterium]HNZ58806.1 efflux RND transporter periplasmic adaptor subunit [Syntrophorhabdaceae bacterium]HOF58057.1 efflux RND transporter periplasmic adaptor subunit [Syntrophorhabdaceae bacterium]
MKSKKKYIVWITVAVIILLVIVVVCLTGKKGRSEKVGGEVFAVKKGNVTNFTEQTGIIKAQVGAIVKVGTRATGELIQLRYQVGDYVKKGELIAKIDDREKIANHRNLKAQIEEQRKDLAAKEAQYQYSKINYEREERLLKQEFTTRDSVDKAKRELDVAIAQVELGRAKVMAAEESLKALEVSLSYNKIYAPISGYVSQVTTQEGETVVAGLSAVNLITVIDASKLEMWIYVDETDIGRVKPGMKVEYRVDAYRDRRFSGNIGLIYPQPEIKENIVYYLAIVKIDPKDTTLLKPEMTTHVRIIISEKTDVLVVPNGSVRFESGKNIVYVKSKDKTERKEVIPGIRDDKFTEIITGLSENEHVVIPTVKRLESGAKK